MAHSTRDSHARASGAGAPDPRVAELERRIRELERLDEAELGRFTGVDWVICVLGAVVGPALAMWWFAG